MNDKVRKRPTGVTIIAVVNILGWLTTEGLWVVLHITGQIPTVSSMNSYFEKSYIGLVNGFTISDLIWSNLTLLLSIIGLWKMKSWGWTAALMANTIWLYTMTFSLVRDLFITLTGTTVFFLSFALFALISTVYLWSRRELFWQEHKNV